MSRQLRIEYENALYHVMARGTRKEPIFYHNDDREFFMEKITDMAIKYHIIMHSYALIGNHYHILLETPEANLSCAMHFLNTAYVNWFKTKYHIIGPILQGRFKGKLIDKEDYFCNASAYIHLNPVRAGLVKAAEDYAWSSYACFIGKQPSPPWLSHELIIGDFSGDIDEYKCFMRKSYLTEKDLVYESLFEEHGLIIGSDAFKEKIKSNLKKHISEKSKQELPDMKILYRLSLNEVKVIVMNVTEISEEAIFSNRRNNLYKKVAMYAFHKHTDATLTDIGKLFSIKYSTVSFMVKQFAHAASSDARVAALLAAIDQAIAERRCQVFD